LKRRPDVLDIKNNNFNGQITVPRISIRHLGLPLLAGKRSTHWWVEIWFPPLTFAVEVEARTGIKINPVLHTTVTSDTGTLTDVAIKTFDCGIWILGNPTLT